MPIIRRNNCIYVTLGIFLSVTNNKCRVNAVISPDDGHIVARNMQRKEINILRKIVHQVGFIYKIIQDYENISRGTNTLIHFSSFLSCNMLSQQP